MPQSEGVGEQSSVDAVVAPMPQSEGVGEQSSVSVDAVVAPMPPQPGLLAAALPQPLESDAYYYHPFNLGNICLDVGYTYYKNDDGCTFALCDHNFGNQFKPMNPLDNKFIYARTMCCSRNLICGKNTYPVGASLSNPEKWTCFLNCILQCLVHTVPLMLKLLKGHLGQCRSGPDELCYYCLLRHHISEVIRLSGDILYPRKFVKHLKSIFQDFKRGQHQDAHEFLRSFLDKLGDSSVASSSSSEEPSSVLKEVFGGQLKSQLHCPQCNHCSERLEFFLDLSVEINQMDTIFDSLKYFTQNEVVENYICDGCKTHVNMEKHLKVEQAPEVLVIHLKRFQNVRDEISKLEKKVKYQLELDLNPFMSSTDDTPQMYDLYGVVEHLGNTAGGHYISYIRSSENNWFLFDDDKVMEMTEERLLEKQVYLLFYVKKRSFPWFSTLLESKDALLSGYLQELRGEGLDESGILIDIDDGSCSYCSSSSDEQDTAEYIFGVAAENKEAVPSWAQGVEENANGSTLFSLPDKNEESCNLGGEPSGKTHGLHEDVMRGSCDSPARSPHALRRVGTSRPGLNSDNITKDNAAETRARKRMKTRCDGRVAEDCATAKW